MFPLRTFLGNKSRCLVQRSFATSALRYRIKNEPSYLDSCYVQSNVLLNQNKTTLKFSLNFSSTTILKDKQNVNIDRASTAEVKSNDILDNIDSGLFEFHKDTPGENIRSEVPQKISEELIEKAKVGTRESFETSDIVNFRAGDWICKDCQYHNFSSRKYCYKCNTSKKRDGLKKPIGMKGISEPRPGDWKCNACGFDNFAHREVCFKCNEPDSSKGNLETAKEKKLENVKEKRSDWYCYDCKSLNFARNTNCFKCKASKTAMMQLSKSETNHSIKEGDWICPQCQFINFARRAVCMKCRSEKM